MKDSIEKKSCPYLPAIKRALKRYDLRTYHHNIGRLIDCLKRDEAEGNKPKAARLARVALEIGLFKREDMTRSCFIKPAVKGILDAQI